MEALGLHIVCRRPWSWLHPELDAPKIQLIITKGSHPDEEAYSGFQGTELAKILRERGVTRVVVCGIATDYCVRATAHDALQEGFEVLLLEDAIRGVEVNPEIASAPLTSCVWQGHS